MIGPVVAGQLPGGQSNAAAGNRATELVLHNKRGALSTVSADGGVGISR